LDKLTTDLEFPEPDNRFSFYVGVVSPPKGSNNNKRKKQNKLCSIFFFFSSRVFPFFLSGLSLNAKSVSPSNLKETLPPMSQEKENNPQQVKNILPGPTALENPKTAKQQLNSKPKSPVISRALPKQTSPTKSQKPASTQPAKPSASTLSQQIPKDMIPKPNIVKELPKTTAKPSLPTAATTKESAAVTISAVDISAAKKTTATSGIQPPKASAQAKKPTKATTSTTASKPATTSTCILKKGYDDSSRTPSVPSSPSLSRTVSEMLSHLNYPSSGTSTPAFATPISTPTATPSPVVLNDRISQLENMIMLMNKVTIPSNVCLFGFLYFFGREKLTLNSKKKKKRKIKDGKKAGGRNLSRWRIE
jgi:hypothetical protein